jgi:phosphate transport system protein
MSKHLQRDLEILKKEILTMGAMVEESMNRALQSLMDRRIDLAEEVIRGDREIDLKEIQVEEECLKVLALHQPVAADLRFIIVVLKVNNDLERIGDLAQNIAERAAYLSRNAPIEVPGDFMAMIEKVRGMVKRSLDSLVNHDTKMAREVCREDIEVDDAHRKIYNVLQAVMEKNPSTVQRAVNTLSVSKNLERIADYATNIAEDVVFMVDGEMIRHGEPDEENALKALHG